MKKVLAILVAAFAFVAVASAQPRALGVRAGWGGELSYQHGAGAGFLEADLGFLANNGFCNFYAGPGAQLGFYHVGDNSGFNAGIAGQLGVEFEIPSVPLNLSLDWRPVYYFNYGGFGWQGIALGIRYRF